MKLFLIALLLSSLPACRSQDEEAAEAEESTTTTAEEVPFTTEIQIYTPPPVKTSERLDLSVLDFSIPGFDSISSEDEVINGVFLIYADIDMPTLMSGDIDIVVKETLGKVCKHFGSDKGAPTIAQMYMDAATLGQKRIGMNYSFQILPPVEAGKECINRLAMVGFGPKEPPFGDLPLPVIRTMMQTEMAAYKPTRFMDMENWFLSVQNLSCDVRRVVKFFNHSRSEDVFPTEEPQCLGGQSVDWEPNLKGEFKTENVGSCAMAGSDACLCATLPGCEWVPLVDGVRKCVWTQTPGVSCDACIYQSKCKMTPQRYCAGKTTPCTCVFSDGDCNWDLSNNSCVYNLQGSTACVACARQSFCRMPYVVRFEPETLSILGSKNSGFSWYINVTFDRLMEFRYFGVGSGISLSCRPNFQGDVPLIFYMDHSRLAIVDNVLHVNTFGLRNEILRDCDLMIQNNALRGTSGLLPYGGMQMNEVLISLPDTLPPRCAEFTPPNSARFVALDVTVIITFNEKIGISLPGEEWIALESGTQNASAVIHIIRLGGNISDPQSDVIVAAISLVDETRVIVDGEHMMVKLDGLVDFSQYYSIALPAGFVFDLMGNTFEGLDRALYAFTTASDATIEDIVDDDKESFEYTWIIATIVGSVVVFLALCLGYIFRKHMKKTDKKAKVMASKTTPQFVTTVQDDGTLKQTAPEPQKFVHDDEDDDGDWSDPISPTGSMYTASKDSFATASKDSFAIASKGSFATGSKDSFASATRIAWGPGSATVNAAEFMNRADKLQVQIIAKPDDPKFDVRSQMRKAGTVVSLAETRQNSAAALKRRMGNEVGPSPRSARKAPTWTPTPQGKSPSMSPKANRLRSRSYESWSSGGSPARAGSKLSARGFSKSSSPVRIGWESPRPTAPNQEAPTLAAISLPGQAE